MAKSERGQSSAVDEPPPPRAADSGWGPGVWPDLPEVRVLRLQPGDAVVLTKRGPTLSAKERHAIERTLRALFPANEVLVVCDGDLSIVRPDVADQIKE